MDKRLQKKKRLIGNLSSVLIFLIIFNLLSIPLYIALYMNFSYAPLQEFNAKLVSASLRILGYESSSDGITINMLLGRPEKIDISWDSTGWKSMYALAALIMSTPISIISRRAKIAFAGIGIIFVLNYIRILTTILISANFGFDWFDIVHTVLWREGLILAVVGLWLAWMTMEKYKIGEIK
jgi:exosortase/archaeosortase family protein